LAREDLTQARGYFGVTSARDCVEAASGA